MEGNEKRNYDSYSNEHPIVRTHPETGKKILEERKILKDFSANVNNGFKILQQKTPDDFVIATGKQHSVRDFINEACKILKIKIPIFPIDGENLKQKGMQEGQTLGIVLKTLEKEWINNNFKISDERVEELSLIHI